MKFCPLCNQDLLVSEFGVCRARKDGRNLYCKSCINAKVTASRLVLKEYKDVQKRRKLARYCGESLPAPDSNPLVRLSPVEKVREAMRNGSRTQAEIALKTRLGKDMIGDALADLLLWNREIRTEIAGTTRRYFLVEEKPLEVPERKSDVLAPFHELQAFMPGRKRAVR